MIPKEAIEKAIEGGWEPYKTRTTLPNWQITALDPAFWQALGKALGWPSVTPGNSVMTQEFPQTWRYHALHFYDLILTGGDTAAFWKSLQEEGK